MGLSRKLGLATGPLAFILVINLPGLLIGYEQANAVIAFEYVDQS